MNGPDELMAGKRADASAELHPIIATRWSPRALDPNGTVGEQSLRALLEAARWAPSNGNTQPARYLVGRRGDATYERIFGVLAPGNKKWAGSAAVLLLGCMVTRNAKGEIPMAEYGVGLASQNLVLQAVAEGLVAHQMAGFSADDARLVFSLPDEVTPLVVIAVGVLDSAETLDEDLRERELAPRRRKPLAEFAFSGDWGNPAF